VPAESSSSPLRTIHCLGWDDVERTPSPGTTCGGYATVVAYESTRPTKPSWVVEDLGDQAKCSTLSEDLLYKSVEA
jgi:hypothetical protein